MCLNRELLSEADVVDTVPRVLKARARLGDIIDRLVARNIVLDPLLLRELGRFLEEEGYAAAEAYRRLVEAGVWRRWPNEPSGSPERGPDLPA